MRLLLETLAALLDSGQGGDPAALLGPEERVVYDSLAAPKRRQEWLAGRVAAKRLVLNSLDVEGSRVLNPQQVQVLSREDGSPAVYIDFGDGRGRRDAEADLGLVGVSISHRSFFTGVPGGEGVSGLVAAAAVRPPLTVGIDVELVESRAPVFEQDYFTREERSWTGGDPFRITVGWSAKEAVLKANRSGLSQAPRTVEVLGVEETTEAWIPLRVLCRSSDKSVRAWFITRGNFVITLALTGEDASGTGETQLAAHSLSL